MLTAFTEATGIKVNLIFAKEGLVERMAAEGRNSPADVLLTNEFAFLTQAKAAGSTQPVTSDALEAAIPATLRDPEGHWFGLTRRARRLRVQGPRPGRHDHLRGARRPEVEGAHLHALGPTHLQHRAHRIDDRAPRRRKGRGVAEGAQGEPRAQAAGGDREGVRDVQAGLCDIAIGNTYYMAAMLKNPDQKAWADAVKIVFPNAEGRGTHVNISGMALAANAPNKAAGVKLMEFLASPTAQKLYAEVNSEYPVVAGTEESALVKSWGPLKADPIPLARIAELRKKASELVDKVKFDSGASS